MKKTHLIFVAVLVLAAAGYYIWQRTGSGDQVTIDLVDLAGTPSAEFRPGEKRAELFRIEPQTVKGETRPALYMHPTSRLIFKQQQVPENGRLQAWIAIKEEAWGQDASDGVLFRFGVGDGRDYNELLNQHVDPRHNANDRGWLPVDIDLSAYAGQQVDLIFNVNSSLPRQGDNAAFDFAIWGQPAVIDRP